MSLRIFKSDAFRSISALAVIFLILATLASGTSDSGVMPQLIDHAMSSQVDESNYQVGTRTSTFQTGDIRAYSWVSLGSIFGAHLVDWRWYSPNGSLYSTYSQAIPDSKPNYNSWDLYNVYASIDIAGSQAASLPGNWHVDVFVDGQKILTEQFTIVPGAGPSETILGQTGQILVNGSSRTIPSNLVPASQSQILDHSMASQVDESTGRATTRASIFQASDIRAYSWVKFGNIYGAHLVEWKWYSPDGAHYESSPVAIPDSKPSFDSWEWYDVYAYIDIAGTNASSLPGNWHVDIFMDGQKILTEQFTIVAAPGPSESILGQTGWTGINGSSTSTAVPGTSASGSQPRILDHSMASRVDESTGQASIRATAFQTSDSKVYSWVKFGSIYGAHLVEWKWYSPNGALYESSSTGIPDSKPNYDSWEWYDIYSSIDIAGSKPSSLPGNWHVDIFMDGQKVLTEQFTIRSAGRTPLQLGSFSQEECYTDPATGRTSCKSYSGNSFGSRGFQGGCYTDPATGQTICVDYSSSLFSSQHIVM
ncbi:Uncharacterised protein [uncultured archaeon]|nr:Uncharacterised protein [uncultured archaeon]